MSERLDSAVQLAGNLARMSWYTGLNWIMQRRARSLAAPPAFEPTLPVPSRNELLADLRSLLRSDAEAVREGVMPAGHEEAFRPLEHLRRLRGMFEDLPSATERRVDRDASSVKELASGDLEDLPDYFKQDFHFQTGGYLSEDSAKLYDIQVETLFHGSAAAMRRRAMVPLARFMQGRDQRDVSFLDVACGTGRLLKDIRRIYPAMRLTGLDLSPSYLEEAQRYFGNLRRARWLAGNAESIPLGDGSQDVVVSVFLFHELPPEVRRTVAEEVNRVLKPGGLFIFIDSLQMGDRPGWDGLLEGFPVRFHEPYYRGYSIDDLEAVFTGVGLRVEAEQIAFLSKMIVCRKDALPG